MTIRTYRAKTPTEALSRLKKDLGSGAVILSTRTLRTGGILGWGRKTFTEITATTEQFAPAKERRRRTSDLATTAPRINRQSQPLDALASEARERRMELVGAGAPAGVEAPETTGPTGPMRDLARMIVDAREPSDMEREMASIKQMVGQVLRTTRGMGSGSMPGPLFDCYLKLMESEVASDIADDIIGSVRDELGTVELEDAGVVQQAVLRRLAAYIPVCEQSASVVRAPDGRPTTVALIGPTGVGKTTTVAKLAATYKLRHGKRVGLVTCDTYRIAAVDQLRTYANIIGIDLKVVQTPKEMASACDALSGCDAILIDTAGRAPRDADRLAQLRGFLDAAKPHQSHLVLSSTACESSLREAAANFGPLGCDRVIFTKLDEAVNFGVLINVASTIDTRLSYVTTGQEVPDHIEPGSPDRIARFVLCGERLG